MEIYSSFKHFLFQYDQIDEEHRGLFDGIFACINGNNAENLAALQKKIDTHFVNEEATMASKNYSGLAEHKQIHAGFVSKLGALKAPLDAASVDWSKQW